MKRNKMMMILLASVLCVAVTGCGGNETEQSESSEILMIDANISEDTTEEETAEATESPEETSTTEKSTTAARVTTKTTAETTKKAARTTKTTTVETTGFVEDSEQVEEEFIQDEDFEEIPEEIIPEETVPAPTEAPTQPPTEAPTLPPENLMLKLGEDCSQYITNIPYLSMAKGISCMGEGYDRTYDYGDYIVYTFADYAGTGDYVQEIDLITSAYSTYAGICVGSTRADVEAAYGTTDNGRYASLEGGFLMFMYDENDVVTLIMYCKD